MRGQPLFWPMILHLHSLFHAAAVVAVVSESWQYSNYHNHNMKLYPWFVLSNISERSRCERQESFWRWCHLWWKRAGILRFQLGHCMTCNSTYSDVKKSDAYPLVVILKLTSTINTELNHTTYQIWMLPSLPHWIYIKGCKCITVWRRKAQRPDITFWLVSIASQKMWMGKYKHQTKKKWWQT